MNLHQAMAEQDRELDRLRAENVRLTARVAEAEELARTRATMFGEAFNERDTARAEVESLKAQLAEAQKRASDLAAWHPHSAVGMTRMVAAEEQLRVAQEALKLGEEALDIHVMADAATDLGIDEGDALALRMMRAALSASAPRAEGHDPEFCHVEPCEQCAAVVRVRP